MLSTGVLVDLGSKTKQLHNKQVQYYSQPDPCPSLLGSLPWPSSIRIPPIFALYAIPTAHRELLDEAATYERLVK